MAYLIENLPEYLDRALLERAAAEQKTPEAVIFDLMSNGLTDTSSDRRRNDQVAGDHRTEDLEFELALREQRMIDWDAWSDGVKRRDLTGIAGQRLITPEMKEVFREQRRIDPDLWK
jgi:plasmid stability protein